MNQRDFEAFYRENWNPVVAIISKKTRNRSVAEDIAQDVFTKFFEKIEYIDNTKSPVGLLYHMASHLTVDFFVKVGRELKHIDQVGLERRWNDAVKRTRYEYELPECSMMQEEERLRLLRSIWTLPKLDRTAVRLVFMAGMTRRECAAAMGLPLGTIAYILKKAQARLENLISRDTLTTPIEQKILSSGTIPDFIDTLSEQERFSLGLVLTEGTCDAKSLETLKRVLCA